MERSLEVIIFVTLTLSVIALVATAVLPLITASTRIPGATVTHAILYSGISPLLECTIKNTGNIGITMVSVIATATEVSRSGSRSGNPLIARGVEKTLSISLTGTGSINAGAEYRVTITVQFEGGDEKVIYSHKHIAVSP